MTRQVNDAALSIIRIDEGLRLVAYVDAPGWAVGYGHAGPDVHEGLTITEARAVELLRADVEYAASAVDKFTHDVLTSDNQFSAMASLTFNIGTGAFRTSDVLRLHRAGSPAAAAGAFLVFDKAHVNGQLVFRGGLLRRRKEEAALYLMVAV